MIQCLVCSTYVYAVISAFCLFLIAKNTSASNLCCQVAAQVQDILVDVFHIIPWLLTLVWLLWSLLLAIDIYKLLYITRKFFFFHLGAIYERKHQNEALLSMGCYHSGCYLLLNTLSCLLFQHLEASFNHRYLRNLLHTKVSFVLPLRVLFGTD